MGPRKYYLISWSSFWGPSYGAPSNNKKLSGEKWIAAVLLTAFFQIVMVGGIIAIMFSHPAANSDGFVEKIADLVHFMSIFSPLATAPVAYMLGIEKIDSK